MFYFQIEPEESFENKYLKLMEEQNTILKRTLKVSEENAAIKKEMLALKKQELLLKKEKFEFLRNKN